MTLSLINFPLSQKLKTEVTRPWKTVGLYHFIIHTDMHITEAGNTVHPWCYIVGAPVDKLSCDAHISRVAIMHNV